ncbi:fimbrial protein [Serratia microhaemolytica]|uniref:fimbrial protein n=1 Tax=Serratia microhaemolytica TaxID=2675110 RepID=UPI000FDD401D|nr:fimbrial protein [Serratia microhaemolytica]
MYHNNPTSRRFLSAIAAGLLLSVTHNVQAAGSSSATVNFSATLVGGTCNVTVDRVTIPFDSVSSSVIIAAGQTGIDPQLLTLSFSDCAGSGGLIPKIQVSGTTITAGIPLFRNNNAASDYSQGYGIRLVQQGQNTAINHLDKLALADINEPISVLESRPLTFEARLSCGSCTPGPGLTGGNLNATVTFQFVYE